MFRRAFIGGALSFAAFRKAFAQKPMKKFYITGFYHTKELNDCTLPPIEAYGTDRVDALTRVGLTVWTEEEWQQMNHVEFQKGCKKIGLGGLK